MKYVSEETEGRYHCTVQDWCQILLLGIHKKELDEFLDVMTS